MLLSNTDNILTIWNFLKYTADVLKAGCISLLKQKHGVGRLFLYCVIHMERIFKNQWKNHLGMKRNLFHLLAQFILCSKHSSSQL